MSEMVERVARAIDEAIANWQPGSPQRIKEMAARAAISAMREPTEAMWDACGKAQADFETGIGWGIMIDEALK